MKDELKAKLGHRIARWLEQPLTQKTGATAEAGNKKGSLLQAIAKKEGWE